MLGLLLALLLIAAFFALVSRGSLAADPVSIIVLVVLVVLLFVLLD